MDCSDVHSQKARIPINLTVFGILIFVIPEHPATDLRVEKQ